MTHERERRCVVAVAATAAVAAAGSWLIRHEPVSAPPPPPITVVAAPARAETSPIDPDDAVGVARSAPGIGPAPNEPPHDDAPVTVHVRGRVTESGVAVAGATLSFYAACDAWRERASDWAITDSSGHYEVELPADCYLVDFQDTGIFATIVLVAARQPAMKFDFEQPAR